MSSDFPNHILLGTNPVVAVVGLEFGVVAIGFAELGFVFVVVAAVVDLVVPHPPLQLLPPAAVVPVVLVLLLPLAPVLGAAAS